MTEAVDAPRPAAKPRKAEIWLYVLELADGHYYVGQSCTLDARIGQHQAGKGSAWTKVHPFVRELVRQPTGTTDWKVAEALENKWTLELMQLRGWERVRGGFWANTCPVQTRKSLISHRQWDVLGLSAPEETPPAIAAAPTKPVVIVRKKRRVTLIGAPA